MTLEIEKSNIVQISEEQLLIFTGERYITLYPETNEFIFLRSKFIIINSITYLVVLMSSICDKVSIIKNYKID